MTRVDVLDHKLDDLLGRHLQLEAVEVGQALIGLRRLDQFRRLLRVLLSASRVVRENPTKNGRQTERARDYLEIEVVDVLIVLVVDHVDELVHAPPPQVQTASFPVVLRRVGLVHGPHWKEATKRVVRSCEGVRRRVRKRDA